MLFVLFGLLLAGIPERSVAQSLWGFVPEPLEWASWPEHCRIQWTQWNGGFDPQGDRIYSDSIRKGLRANLGEQTYDGLHHWCAGIHYFARSRFTTDAKTKQFELQRAAQETLFTYERASVSSVVFPNISVTLAQIRSELGKQADAVDILQRAIEAHPQRLEPYIALISLHKDAKNLELAKAVLKEARKHVSEDAVEAHYNLGLLSVEVGEIEDAVASAKIAYGRGYPLPGLKQRLIRLGKWEEPSSLPDALKPSEL